MKSFIKITLIALGLSTITSCETKKPTTQTTGSPFSDSIAKADSMKHTILRDTNETDVQDTMLDAHPLEFDLKKK